MRTIFASVIVVAHCLSALASARVAANPGAGDRGSALTAQEVQDALNYHNKVRKEVGVGPLKWSNDVAKVAQEWADHLAETGEIEHRAAPRKYGENIAFDSTVLKGAEAWYTEIKSYTKGTPFNPQDQAGHYTQMVWRNSTEIGIGKAVIKKGPFKGMLAIVGNYNPPGNYVGEKPY